MDTILSSGNLDNATALYGRLYEHIQRECAKSPDGAPIYIVYGESHKKRDSLLALEMIRDIAAQPPINTRLLMREVGPIGLEAELRATDATGMNEALLLEYRNAREIVSASLTGGKAALATHVNNSYFMTERSKQTGSECIPLEPDLASVDEKTFQQRNIDMAEIAAQHGSGILEIGGAHLAGIADELEEHGTVIRIMGSPEEAHKDIGSYAAVMDSPDDLKKGYDSSFHASPGFDVADTELAPHEIIEIARQAGNAYKEQHGMAAHIDSTPVPSPPTEMQQPLGEVIRNELLLNVLVRQGGRTVESASQTIASATPAQMQAVEGNLTKSYPALRDLLDGKPIGKESQSDTPNPVVEKKGVVFKGPIRVEVKEEHER